MTPRTLTSVMLGAVFTLAYGLTTGFGFGLPPYSLLYALALGVIVGIAAYLVLSTGRRWAPWLVGVTRSPVAFRSGNRYGPESTGSRAPPTSSQDKSVDSHHRRSVSYRSGVGLPRDRPNIDGDPVAQVRLIE